MVKWMMLSVFDRDLVVGMRLRPPPAPVPSWCGRRVPRGSPRHRGCPADVLHERAV